jgi:6-phosphofructokinase 1
MQEIVRDCAVYTVPAVTIVEIMGRDAGWLTASAALPRIVGGAAPDFVYLPESVFSMQAFFNDIRAAFEKKPNLVIAVSEGIRDANGESIGARFAGGEKDSHGNVQMSGTGALGDHLAGYLKSTCRIQRVRADTFGYLQRSFPGVRSETDAAEARLAGESAVKAALKGDIVKGTIAILRAEGRRYQVAFAPRPIAEAAKYTRSMPPEYIAANGHDVTAEFLDYARPIVGILPECAVF